jgi:hypothetical protein
MASSNTWHHPTHGIIQHMASSNVSSKAQARHVHRTAYRAYIAMLYRLTLVSSEQVELEARCVARRRPDTRYMITCTSGVRLELGSTSLSLFRGNLGFFGGNSQSPGRPLASVACSCPWPGSVRPCSAAPLGATRSVESPPRTLHAAEVLCHQRNDTTGMRGQE